MEITKTEPPKRIERKLTKEDVWGDYLKGTKGMVIARGGHGSATICPIWGDALPYKSVTVVCKAEEEDDVLYWLTYVHGGNNVSKRKNLGDGTIAIRSNYTCW